MGAPAQDEPHFAGDVTSRSVYTVAKERKELSVLEGYLGVSLAVLIPHSRLGP
jgi:hypothetical protein